MLSYLTEARVYSKQFKDNRSALSGSKSNHGDHKKKPETGFPGPLYPAHACRYFMGKPGEILCMTALVTSYQTFVSELDVCQPRVLPLPLDEHH